MVMRRGDSGQLPSETNRDVYHFGKKYIRKYNKGLQENSRKAQRTNCCSSVVRESDKNMSLKRKKPRQGSKQGAGTKYWIQL